MSPTMDMEPTLQDVINAVNAGFTDVAVQFAKIESTMVSKEDLKRALAKFVTKEELKQELAGLETRLVTKDYLDKKLHDLRGDLTVSLRKEDDKVVALVSILKDRSVISKEDAQRVMGMELFPRTMI